MTDGGNEYCPAIGYDYGKPGFAGDLFRLRFRRLRLSQREFADRFGLSFAQVRTHEQARYATPMAIKLIVAAIELDPDLMARAAKAAIERWPQ